MENQFKISKGVLTNYKGNDLSIKIPEGVSEVDLHAFRKCLPATRIHLPKSVIKIYVGFGCDYSASLEAITVDPENKYFATIDGNLYNREKNTLIHYCLSRSEKSFTVPSGVSIIGDRAFFGCRLKQINLSNVVKIKKSAFSQSENLEQINFSQSLEIIGEAAFQNCRKLISVELPNGVLEIEQSAFNSCLALKQIILPNTLTTIGAVAFGYCKALEKIVIPKSVTSVADNLFYGFTKNQIIYVNNETSKHWNENWKAYSSAKIEFYDNIPSAINIDIPKPVITALQNNIDKQSTNFKNNKYSSIPGKSGKSFLDLAKKYNLTKIQLKRTDDNTKVRKRVLGKTIDYLLRIKEVHANFKNMIAKILNKYEMELLSGSGTEDISFSGVRITKGYVPTVYFKAHATSYSVWGYHYSHTATGRNMAMGGAIQDYDVYEEGTSGYNCNVTTDEMFSENHGVFESLKALVSTTSKIDVLNSDDVVFHDSNPLTPNSNAQNWLDYEIKRKVCVSFGLSDPDYVPKDEYGYVKGMIGSRKHVDNELAGLSSHYVLERVMLIPVWYITIQYEGKEYTCLCDDASENFFADYPVRADVQAKIGRLYFQKAHLKAVSTLSIICGVLAILLSWSFVYSAAYYISHGNKSKTSLVKDVPANFLTYGKICGAAMLVAFALALFVRSKFSKILDNKKDILSSGKFLKRYTMASIIGRIAWVIFLIALLSFIYFFMDIVQNINFG